MGCTEYKARFLPNILKCKKSAIAEGTRVLTEKYFFGSIWRIKLKPPVSNQYPPFSANSLSGSTKSISVPSGIGKQHSCRGFIIAATSSASKACCSWFAFLITQKFFTLPKAATYSEGRGVSHWFVLQSITQILLRFVFDKSFAECSAIAFTYSTCDSSFKNQPPILKIAPSPIFLPPMNTPFLELAITMSAEFLPNVRVGIFSVFTSSLQSFSPSHSAASLPKVMGLCSL